MAVAAGKQRARHEHRQIEFGAGAQFLVVEVAAHRARDQRGDAAPGRRRRDAHHAEKRRQRQIEPPWHPADHALAVERNVEQPGLVEIVRQGAGQGADQVPAPVLPQLDVENFDLQHVAGLGALDRDRTGQDMAGQHPLAFGVNLGQLGRHVKLRAIRHRVRAAADGVDGHLIAAGDGEDGFQFRFEKAPVAGLGAGLQMVVRHGGFPGRPWRAGSAR